MNIYQTNRCNMMDAVLSYLTLNAAAISKSTGLTEAIDKLTVLMEAIWVKDNEKSGAKAGKSDKKNSSKESLEQQTLDIAAGLFLWGKRNKSPEIKALAEMKKSDFTRLRDAVKITKAKAIFNAAAGKDLSFADITEEDIVNLGKAADDFKKNIGDISTAAASKIGAGITLDQMIDEAIKLMNEDFDKYMKHYETKNLQLYASYKAARVIHDKGGKQANHTEIPQTAAAQAG
ncbi:MAG TPA: hypothetical protein VMT35_15800 [Ignavibacteriaceae bacterium]|nr:hypothetical protein [Ignavibacteriaceae bacterium]